MVFVANFKHLNKTEHHTSLKRCCCW